MCKEEIMQYLDISFKAATIIIALANLALVIKFFKVNTEKEDIEKEKDRKILWLKTLVLDNNLDYFYQFFDNVEVVLNGLKTENHQDDFKKDIDEKIGDHFIILRRKFTDSLIAIDENLYTQVLNCFDVLQTHITESIFDNGINLAHQPKFEEIILEKITSTKTSVIKTLFCYRG